MSHKKGSEWERQLCILQEKATMASTDYVRLDVDDHDDTPVKPVHRSRKGCCFCLKYCCLVFTGAVGLFLLGAVGLYIHYGGKIVRTVTVTTPKELPVVDIPLAQLNLVVDRAMLFVDTIRAGNVPKDDFVVTEEEINGFFGQENQLLRGNFYLSLNENNEIRSDFSIPTDFLPGGSGRYFVGSEVVDIDRKSHEIAYDLDIAATHEKAHGSSLVLAVFRYAMDNFNSKHLGIYLQSLSILGEDQVGGLIAQEENLLEHFYIDPGVSQIFEKIDSITIENNSIIVKPRRGDSSTAASW